MMIFLLLSFGSLSIRTFIRMAVCCAFDRFGLYLACGCSDGRLVVWDFTTRSVTREYLAHAQAVTSVR
jgi:WD40 repeat protein